MSSADAGAALPQARMPFLSLLLCATSSGVERCPSGVVDHAMGWRGTFLVNRVLSEFLPLLLAERILPPPMAE